MWKLENLTSILPHINKIFRKKKILLQNNEATNVNLLINLPKLYRFLFTNCPINTMMVQCTFINDTHL